MSAWAVSSTPAPAPRHVDGEPDTHRLGVDVMPSRAQAPVHLPGSGAQGPHGADLPASAWGLWALQPGACGGVPSCCLLTPVLVTASVGLGGTQVRHHHHTPGVWRLQGRLGPAVLGKQGGRSLVHPGLAPPSARHLNTHSLPQFLPHNHEAGTISPILLNKETELRS